MSGPGPSGERPHFFDRAENVRLVLRVLYAVCALLLLLDLPNLRHGDRAWGGAPGFFTEFGFWEGLPGFYNGFGFLACVALVLAAKQLRRLLMRDEDYYDG